MSRPPRAEHQRQDIKWIQRVEKGLLANEPGVGKSRSAIEATDGGRVLVVAPNMVLAGGTWDDELSKWANNPEMFTQAAYSSLNDRVKTGTNSSATKPVKRLRPEFKGRWDALVIDEAHYVKGRQTSWTWAVQEIAKNADIVLPMTGTPIPNWSHELFTLLQLIHGSEESKPGARFGSFWRWAEEWFDCTPTRFSGGAPVAGELLGCVRAGKTRCLSRPANDPCEHYTAFTQANLGDRYRRVLRDDVLDLPPLVGPVEILTPLETDGKRAYRELRKDFATTYEGTEVLAWSQGAKNNLLDLITVSPWFLTQQGPPRGGKLERLRFDLQSRSRPTLVLAHHRDVVEACVEVARSVGAKADLVYGGAPNGDAVKAFKSGSLDVLVGSLETVSEGLTLTVADMAIFVETSFKPSRNEQAKFRLHRMGQTRPVTLLDYVTPGTVDRGKRRLLAVKTDRQMRTLTAAQFMEIIDG